jgi:SAM-dependent methyltransferase
MASLNLISTKPQPPEGGPPILFDRTLLRQHKYRASGDFIAHDFLFARAAEDMVDRVASVNRTFKTCLIIGGGGAVTRAFNSNPHADAKIGTQIEADLSISMMQPESNPRLVLDEEFLPIEEGSVDLVLCCLNLHWTNDLVGALIQINYALKPDGLFVGSILGGNTLSQLRSVFKALEGDNAQPRISPFAGTIDMAGLLGRAGYAMPVSDIDRVTVRYPHLMGLLRDLKTMGETNSLIARTRKPATKSFFLTAAQTYYDMYGEPDGKIPASFDIIHFSGWGPHPDQPKPKRPGSAKARLADALGVSEFNAGEKAGGR